MLNDSHVITIDIEKLHTYFYANNILLLILNIHAYFVHSKFALCIFLTTHQNEYS